MSNPLDKTADSLLSMVYGFSEEHRQAFISAKCSSCSGSLRNKLGIYTILYYRDDGATKVPLWQISATGGWGANIAECPACQYRWSVHPKSQVTPPVQLSVVDLAETSREEEFIGTEQRVIDNSRSSSSLKRRFSIEKNWTKSYSISQEDLQTNSTELGIGLDKLSLKNSSEEAIKKQYSISEQKQENYKEEFEIEVPARTKLQISLAWKRIWQHGKIIFADQNNNEIAIPFKVAIGMTFDQTQADETLNP